jgi:acyl carrier protein
MNGEIFDDVRGVAADIFKVDVRLLNASSSPEQVEAWDSLRHLNLVLALEGKYGIAFEPEEMERMKNLGEIASLVGSKIGD